MSTALHQVGVVIPFLDLKPLNLQGSERLYVAHRHPKRKGQKIISDDSEVVLAGECAAVLRQGKSIFNK